VVSDVHGSVDALARAGDGADGLICLGDLVLFLDYDDPAGGIFGELFGAEATETFVALRTAGDFDAARAFAGAQWERIGGDRAEHLQRAVHAQYDALFAVMPDPTWLTYGNVDVPAYWPDHLRPGQRVVDGASVTIDGLRFGFVGGGLRTAYRTPFERDDDEYDAAVAALGPVDVLCTHIPPALPELTYDVVARRFERGSAALLAYLHEHRPALHLHGHVHQPLVARTRVGRTEVVNVGHFRGTGTPFVLRW